MEGVGVKHISARNVLAIEEGAINTEVVITIGKSTIVAIIKASAQSMELQVNSEAATIIKGSSVMIACE